MPIRYKLLHPNWYYHVHWATTHTTNTKIKTLYFKFSLQLFQGAPFLLLTKCRFLKH